MEIVASLQKKDPPIDNPAITHKAWQACTSPIWYTP